MIKKILLVFSILFVGSSYICAENQTIIKAESNLNIQEKTLLDNSEEYSTKIQKNTVSLDSKQTVPEKPPLSRDKWSLFQIGFLPKFPSYTKVSNVYGIKIGAPMCSGYGRVYGIEPSLLYSGTRYVNGIQATFWGTCISREVYGIQAASFGPSITSTIYGLQADGTLGMAEEVIGAQIAPVTLCAGELTGIQFGALNLSKKQLTGFQGGAVNISAVTNGLQFGVFNYSDIDGFQIGGINIIRNGWLPFMIGINFKF
jgi:hypothetical protein